LACGALVFFVWLVFKATSRDSGSLAWISTRYQWSAGIFLLLWSQAVLGFAELYRPLSMKDGATLGCLAGISILAAGLSYLLGRRMAKLMVGRSHRTKRSFVWPLTYLATLMIVTAAISYAASQNNVRERPYKSSGKTGKVLLLGLDAADWSLLTPLIENGKMPNLARLVREGVSGNLTSLISPWGAMAGDSITYGIESPAIWNTIATGKDPRKHGIKDFFLTEMPLIEHTFRHRLIPAFVPFREDIERLMGFNVRPYTRFLRKSSAAWNILSDAGLKVGVLGWWDTWPAEEVNGEILSDRFADPNLNRRWSPLTAVTQADITSLKADLASYPQADLTYFTSFRFNPAFGEQYGKESYEYIRNELLNNFISTYLLDRFKSSLGQRWLREKDHDFFGVYYYALDVAGHAFTRFRQPELFVDVEGRDAGYFGGIIEKYCSWFDTELGRYLEEIDAGTTVIICSDHGMGPWNAARSERNGVRLSGSHRREGILVMWGHNVRKGDKVTHASVLDILPTILYLLGMPPAGDMDGSVIQDALDPALVSSVPIRETDTYETKRYDPRLGQRMDALRAGDKNEMKKLKALGYLK
jgi:predicted AlkP superfamily phosphohydrolase/phosphomutase